MTASIQNSYQIKRNSALVRSFFSAEHVSYISD